MNDNDQINLEKVVKNDHSFIEKIDNDDSKIEKIDNIDFKVEKIDDIDSKIEKDDFVIKKTTENLKVKRKPKTKIQNQEEKSGFSLSLTNKIEEIEGLYSGSVSVSDSESDLDERNIDEFNAPHPLNLNFAEIIPKVKKIGREEDEIFELYGYQ